MAEFVYNNKNEVASLLRIELNRIVGFIAFFFSILIFLVYCAYNEVVVMSKLIRKGLKLALVQMEGGTKNKVQNIKCAISYIEKAKSMGADIVALPEFFNAPYGTKYFAEYAEEVPSGNTCCALSEAAARHNVCVVGGTLPERCGDKLYNTCTVWSSTGELIATHRKVHLFDIDIPGKITFKESETLSPGQKITTFDFRDIKIGIGICYDIRFPELSTLMAQEGCSLLIYPAAFNMTTGPKHWQLLARSRANDHQLWVAVVSPARDEAADYVAWGHTLLVDPWGSVVDEMDEKPGIAVHNIDLKTVEDVRSQIPIRSQRRTDIYDTVSLTKRTH